ncbi:hypothetical protein Tco_0441022, partial [Tanacetum coccineum]
MVVAAVMFGGGGWEVVGEGGVSGDVREVMVMTSTVGGVESGVVMLIVAGRWWRGDGAGCGGGVVMAAAAMEGKVGMMLSGSMVGVVLWWDGDGGVMVVMDVDGSGGKRGGRREWRR